MRSSVKGKSILFVAFPFSIHTVRWINQLTKEDWQIHLFSSHPFSSPHPELSSKVIYHSNPFGYKENARLDERIRSKLVKASRKISGKASPGNELVELISQIKPSIVHSLETQHAGYLVSEARSAMSSFPTWIHSNWGIDLHFFRQLKDHTPRLSKLLLQIDIFITEGERDALLARSFGFRGPIHTFPSVGGGFRIPHVEYKKPSERKLILVKGTQDIVRRGLIALNAIERCIDLLKDYEIILYSSCHETRVAAELITFKTGKAITVASNYTQDEMLKLNAEARLSLCTNLSDGLPNCMVEAMLMGCFPIQSDTSLASEWVEHGKTGMIVPPEDAAVVAECMKEALTNDDLVNQAAPGNMAKTAKAFDFEATKEKAVAMYLPLLSPGVIRGHQNIQEEKPVVNNA